MRHIGPFSLPALSPPISTLSFDHCRTLEKSSPGSASGPRLWAGSSPQWSWARLSPGVQREKPETASSIQTFWARSSGHSYGTGPQGGGEEVGPYYTPFSHLEKQREAKHKAHLEEPVSTDIFQAHLGG
uniref:Uncharacterized protein n=1 Tax=Myotis myotis TaxID=51298 RepID=A0A7J7TTS0_MYOMY|nr:hypothetical protein mMyoMyo1_008962 [Myotis myotis]